MPFDQTQPQRLPELVEAFAQTARAIVDLARACSDDDLAQPTECPGWTVHDQISHVAGVEAWLAGHQDPRVQVPPYEHIRNDLGKKVEYAVEVRRGRTGAEVLAELEDLLAQRLQTLRDPMLTDTSIIAGPFGPDQAATVMLLRTFDVWTHEQDIRSALGRPGNLDSPAAAVCVSSIMHQLPKLIAKGAAVEPGHRVVMEVTGPGSAVTARQRVDVELDQDGRPRGRAISAGEAIITGDSTQTSEEALDHQTTISLSTEAFTRRAAGRRSVSDTAYRVLGDDAIARRVLEALVVTH
ncbi:MAG TPA: maleylpyruvate isomerase family mycothiol-dependent enzyme [Dermatophilaceae bacterium]|nr:maleylpyruvate isomerase family mycothiol-dependent enzyme [Dermatophilaceae bacterium]